MQHPRILASERQIGDESAITSVAVIGLGYVGLPIALAFASQGHRVTGLDVDPTKIAALMSSRSYIDEVSDDALAQVVSAGTLTATTELELLRSAENIIICVPTPLKPTRDPDLSFVESAADAVARILRPGHLVVLESTTYPGTTDEVVLPRLLASGLEPGTDFHLAYSPERVDPGSTSSHGYSLRTTPKIVGGLTPACLQRAIELYERVVDELVPVSTVRIAEMAKLFENVFRVVNVAMVNEMALLCDRMGIDVWEVLDAAGTKPFGMMKFSPGPGVGGHCIPIDPFYLTWKAREFEFHTRFIELAGEINVTMPYHVRDLVIRALNSQRRSLMGSRVLIIGVAYKKDVSDVRESPAIRLIDLLRHDGVDILYHDPHVPAVRGVQGENDLLSVPLTAELLGSVDCAVIITDHSTLDLGLIAANAPVVLDTRNALRRAGLKTAKLFRI